ncbi:MAG: ferritin-like domain-containing protein [Sphingobacteriales bacterium]|nr:MAG: ferritin-like domain-containing protein [Sphingobacteriales bacterium]
MPQTTKKTAGRSSDTANNKNTQEDRNAPLMQLFTDALKDMYWAEQAIIEGLKKLQQAATNEELTEAFEDHEMETKKHVSRLEKVFEQLGLPAEAKKCAAMEGILKEAEEIIKNTPEGSATRDAGLIIAAQKVEHYEIASYGGLVAIAHTLGQTKAAKLLQKTLDEEEETDLHLTDIAETAINFEAAEEGDEANETEAAEASEE